MIQKNGFTFSPRQAVKVAMIKAINSVTLADIEAIFDQSEFGPKDKEMVTDQLSKVMFQLTERRLLKDAKKSLEAVDRA